MTDDDNKLYRIIRFYRGRNNDYNRERDLSLEEAQEHCSRDDTREEGVWFDGYTEQD